jgi:hypothetical protein
MPAVSALRSDWLSGPVRGGIRSANAPGDVAVARGVSPIALNARNPNRTPSRVTTTGRDASA